MACWSVKAHLLGDDGKTLEIRRISVPVTDTYDQLYAKTQSVFPDLHNAEISLSWKDGDGDLVSFSSDEEMSEFTRTAKDEFLRIFIKARTPKSIKSTPQFPDGAERKVNPWLAKIPDMGSEEFAQSVIAGMRTVFEYISGAETLYDKDRNIMSLSEIMNKEEREPPSCNNADYSHRAATRDSENQETCDVEKDDVEKDVIETDDAEKDVIETDDIEKDRIEADDVAKEDIETDDVEIGHDSSNASQPTEDVPKFPNEIEGALEKLLAMGFHNEEGWLHRLIEEKGGRIDEVLESILPDDNRAGSRRRNRVMCCSCFRYISADACYQCDTCDMILCQSCKEAYKEISVLHEFVMKPTSAAAQKFYRWQDYRISEEDGTKPLDVWIAVQKLLEGMYCAQSSRYSKQKTAKPKSRDPVNRASPHPSCKINRTKSGPGTGGKPDIETDGPVTREDFPKNGESWTMVEDDTSLAKANADKEIKKNVRTNGKETEEKSHEVHPKVPPSDPRIASALTEMMSMGFQNDDGWLQCLLEENNGDIEKVLDIIQSSDGKNYSK